MSREMRKTGKSVALIPTPLNFDMEILQTAPVFIAFILVIYGAFLSGFTGGAIAGGGILFYVMSFNCEGSSIKSMGRYSRSIGYSMVFMANWIFGTIRIPKLLVIRIDACCIWSIY